MNRIAAMIATATVAGSFLLAAPAHADPVIDLRVDGAPVSSGGSGAYGQAATYHLTGCLTPEGDPGYFGQFVTWESEPGRPDEQNEFAAAGDGSFDLELTIPLSEMTRVLTVNWYCASAPISSRTAPEVMWMSPDFTFTIQEAPSEAFGARQAAASSSSKARMARKASTVTLRPNAAVAALKTTPTDGPAVSLTVDPDALPLRDAMGIDGPHAAALKARVDGVAAFNSKVSQMFNRLVGKRRTIPTVSNTDYVSAAFVVAGRFPTPQAMKPFIARLDRGELRVTVVEDIALTQHSAAWWNRR